MFDPEDCSFDYLVAPEQPDGVPLLCYNWTDGERFAITGCVIPYAEPGVPGDIHGSWIVLQNQPADREPGFGCPDVNFDRIVFAVRQAPRGSGNITVGRWNTHTPSGDIYVKHGFSPQDRHQSRARFRPLRPMPRLCPFERPLLQGTLYEQ